MALPSSLLVNVHVWHFPCRCNSVVWAYHKLITPFPIIDLLNQTSRRADSLSTNESPSSKWRRSRHPRHWTILSRILSRPPLEHALVFDPAAKKNSSSSFRGWKCLHSVKETGNACCARTTTLGAAFGRIHRKSCVLLSSNVMMLRGYGGLQVTRDSCRLFHK